MIVSPELGDFRDRNLAIILFVLGCQVRRLKGFDLGGKIGALRENVRSPEEAKSGFSECVQIELFRVKILDRHCNAFDFHIHDHRTHVLAIRNVVVQRHRSLHRTVISITFRDYQFVESVAEKRVALIPNLEITDRNFSNLISLSRVLTVLSYLRKCTVGTLRFLIRSIAYEARAVSLRLLVVWLCDNARTCTRENFPQEYRT